MELTRRSFLTACIAVAGSPAVDGLPAAGSDDLRPPEEFPWTEISRALRSQYPDLRRHFAFEYYPWYATDPYRHWQQWGREPPTDLAASSLPLLGGYDSRSVAVVEQHARWMVECGIGVVDLSWWGPGSFSDRAVSLVMDVMHAHDIQVTFHLEPYGRARVDRFASDIQYLLTEYGEKRGWDAFFLHQRADGTRGPVFKLFSTTLPEQIEDCHGVMQDVPGYVPDSAWRRSTDQVHELLHRMFPHVTLLSDTWDARRVKAAGFDGIATYDPAVEPASWLDHALVATRQGIVFSFNANAGMDEIGRRKLPPDSCLTPRSFLPEAPGLDWSNPEDRERARQLGTRQILDTLQHSLFLQTHPWLGNVDAGFFLVYITSFNEWHEGTQFEPMKDAAALTPEEWAVGYHNPRDGSYRLRQLGELLARL